MNTLATNPDAVGVVFVVVWTVLMGIVAAALSGTATRAHGGPEC